MIYYGLAVAAFGLLMILVPLHRQLPIRDILMMIAASAGGAVWNIYAARYSIGPLPTWASALYLASMGVTTAAWTILARRTVHRGWWPGWQIKGALSVLPLALGLCAFLPPSWWERVFWTTEPWRDEEFGVGYQIHYAWAIMVIAIGCAALIRRAEFSRGLDTMLPMAAVMVIAIGIGAQLANVGIMSTTGTISFAILVWIHLRLNPNSVAAMAQVSERDPVTGAMTRSALDSVLRHAVRQAENHNTPLSLMVIDVDNFKDINDEHGHLTGDAALRHVSAQIKGIVGETVGRFGGDEFVVVLPATNAYEAHELADRIVEFVGRPLRTGDREVHISISVGVAEYGDGSVSDLLISADRAMYSAKRSGGGVANLAFQREDAARDR